MRFVFLLTFALAHVLSAQAVSFGILGGVTLNDVAQMSQPTVPIYSIPKSADFTVGASLQVKLAGSFGFEGDFLYRPYDLNLTSTMISLVGSQTTTRISASQFRVPLLVRYRFRAPGLRPFVEVGVSIDHLSNVSASSTTLVFLFPPPLTSPGGIPTSGPGQLREQSHVGGVFGGGVEVKVPLVRISAEVRYSRYGEYFRGFSNVNQEEILFGIHF